MSHSHMPVNHLIRQVELYRERRRERDVRPAAVTEFIEAAAELFEPLMEEGRVGFDCCAGEQRW
ncbi:MAG: hypothetical protein ACREIV_16900, partial [Planctomycetaceae bacterium]